MAPDDPLLYHNIASGSKEAYARMGEYLNI